MVEEKKSDEAVLATRSIQSELVYQLPDGTVLDSSEMLLRIYNDVQKIKKATV